MFTWPVPFRPCHLFGFLYALVPGLIAYFCVRLFATSMQKADSIPYAPLVSEQIAALPAEEVLLRGSDQLAATPEELLRAASAGKMKTPSEELLRAERGV
jgi:hypothetical protein